MRSASSHTAFSSTMNKNVRADVERKKVASRSAADDAPGCPRCTPSPSRDGSAYGDKGVSPWAAEEAWGDDDHGNDDDDEDDDSGGDDDERACDGCALVACVATGAVAAAAAAPSSAPERSGASSTFSDMSPFVVARFGCSGTSVSAGNGDGSLSNMGAANWSDAGMCRGIEVPLGNAVEEEEEDVVAAATAAAAAAAAATSEG